VSTRAPTEEAAEEPGSAVEVAEVDTAAAPSLSKRFFNLRTLFSFALGFAILAFLFTRVQIDVGAILDRVRQANPLLLVLAFVAFYATFPIRAVRWRRLLDNVELSTHEEGGGRDGRVLSVSRLRAAHETRRGVQSGDAAWGEEERQRHGDGDEHAVCQQYARQLRRDRVPGLLVTGRSNPV